MALIKYLTGFPIASPDNSFFSAVFDGDLQPPTTTQIVVAQPNGHSIVFYGTFTVAGNDVTGGTMTGYDVFAGSTRVLKASGFSISGSALFDAIENINTNADPFFDLFENVPVDIVGSNLDDFIEGNDANDILRGRAGNDRLFGNDGDDNLKAGTGNDTLMGWHGFDKLKGGAGLDVFGFFINPMDLPVGYDKLKDFVPGEDLIGLSFELGNGPPPGYLGSQYFHKGTVATTPEQLVIYDKQAGNIFIDLDGSGAQAQFLLATVKPGTKLQAEDFYIDAGLMVS
ncbi:MAG TPA: hypothetical protein VFK86_00575 [Bauldia sp.]|nr:hypothetical protein [Bauldia sp.]